MFQVQDLALLASIGHLIVNVYFYLQRWWCWTRRGNTWHMYQGPPYLTFTFTGRPSMEDTESFVLPDFYFLCFQSPSLCEWKREISHTESEGTAWGLILLCFAWALTHAKPRSLHTQCYWCHTVLLVCFMNKNAWKSTQRCARKSCKSCTIIRIIVQWTWKGEKIGSCWISSSKWGGKQIGPICGLFWKAKWSNQATKAARKSIDWEDRGNR